MQRFNIRIRDLMGAVVFLAAALAALRNPDDYWAGGLLIVTLVLLGTAVLAVVYERGRSRAGWLGFLVFGGAYLALSVGQLPSAAMSAKLPTTRLMSYAHARVDAAARLRAKLVFQIIDQSTGTMSFDEAAIQADPSQKWKAIVPGAVNYEAFSLVGHCLVALLAGLLGAVIARRYQARHGRALETDMEPHMDMTCAPALR